MSDILPADFCQLFAVSKQEQLALEVQWEALTGDWDGGNPYCLDMAFFRETYPLARGPFSPAEMLPYAEETLRICAEHPELRLLAHICVKGAYDEKLSFLFSSLPAILPFLEEKYTGVFALMLSLGVYPAMKKAHAALGLPAHYADDTMAWIGGQMIAYREGHEGLPGRSMALSWLTRYPKNILFRIGRLEYLTGAYPAWMPAVYRDAQGNVVALCNEGWQLRADGGIVFPGDELFMTAHLTETMNTVSGTLIRPDGTVEMDKTTTLDKTIWQPAAAPWNLCPTVHIPGGGRMPFDEVLASLKEAREFFRTYFRREVPFFSCCSWILAPVWEDVLQNSNMVRFRREMYAFPTRSWGKYSGMGCLFGRSDVPPEELPAHNSAQKAMQEASRRNGLGTGGIFVMADDLDKIGAEYYRSRGIRLA